MEREEGWYWVKFSGAWRPVLLEDGRWWSALYCEYDNDEWFNETFSIGPKVEKPENLDD